MSSHTNFVLLQSEARPVEVKVVADDSQFAEARPKAPSKIKPELMDVVVSSISNPGEFYVQLSPSLEDLEE